MVKRRKPVDKNFDHISNIVSKLKSINYVQPGEVPGIDLYMDQVTSFLDEHLETSKRYSDDKLLTKTMINNYTKNELLPSPEKKKYTKEHMYLLLFVYYLKNILSISDTRSILRPLTEKFFKEKDSVNFEKIYAEIFKIEQEQSFDVTRDVVHKYRKSKKSFENLDDGEDKELLQMFTFISMLSFDVYMKKHMIGKMIDDYFSKLDVDSEKKDKEQ
ncbi:MAG: DUF1836 domain-containing protein [Lachnospiraceae bacterium]|nr:DUF1836 domain-containing protein [Lachnospiraceae bacterium]